ncbi:MAG: hypothetical protein U9Q22_07695, partial [Candidatus Altiarchaeota archaeon]|nr:hypothetical protein [Candidatus Altiarchaeota archaeon]
MKTGISLIFILLIIASLVWAGEGFEGIPPVTPTPGWQNPADGEAKDIADFNIPEIFTFIPYIPNPNNIWIPIGAAIILASWYIRKWDWGNTINIPSINWSYVNGSEEKEEEEEKSWWEALLFWLRDMDGDGEISDRDKIRFLMGYFCPPLMAWDQLGKIEILTEEGCEGNTALLVIFYFFDNDFDGRLTARDIAIEIGLWVGTLGLGKLALSAGKGTWVAAKIIWLVPKAEKIGKAVKATRLASGAVKVGRAVKGVGTAIKATRLAQGAAKIGHGIKAGRVVTFVRNGRVYKKLEGLVGYLRGKLSYEIPGRPGLTRAIKAARIEAVTDYYLIKAENIKDWQKGVDRTALDKNVFHYLSGGVFMPGYTLEQRLKGLIWAVEQRIMMGSLVLRAGGPVGGIVMNSALDAHILALVDTSIRGATYGLWGVEESPLKLIMDPLGLETGEEESGETPANSWLSWLMPDNPYALEMWKEDGTLYDMPYWFHLTQAYRKSWQMGFAISLPMNTVLPLVSGGIRGGMGGRLGGAFPTTTRVGGMIWKGAKYTVDAPLAAVRFVGRYTSPLLRYAPVRAWAKISHLYTQTIIGTSFLSDMELNYHNMGLMGIPWTASYWATLGIPYGLWVGATTRDPLAGYNATFGPAILHIVHSPFTANTFSERLTGIFFLSSALLAPGNFYRRSNKSKIISEFKENHPDASRKNVSKMVDWSARWIGEKLGMKPKQVLNEYPDLVRADVMLGRSGRKGMYLSAETLKELTILDKACSELGIDLNAKIKAKYSEGITTREAAVKAVITDLKNSMPKFKDAMDKLIKDYKETEGYGYNINDNQKEAIEVGVECLVKGDRLTGVYGESGKTSTILPGIGRLAIEIGKVKKVFIAFSDLTKLNEGWEHKGMVEQGEIRIGGKSRKIKVAYVSEKDLDNPFRLREKIENADVIFTEKNLVGFTHNKGLGDARIKKVWNDCFKKYKTGILQDEIQTAKEYLKTSGTKKIPFPKYVKTESMQLYKFLKNYMGENKLSSLGNLENEFTIKSGRNILASQKFRDVYAKHLGLDSAEKLSENSITALNNAAKAIRITDRDVGFGKIKGRFGERLVTKPRSSGFTEGRKEISNPWEAVANEIYQKEKFLGEVRSLNEISRDINKLKMSVDHDQTEYYSALADIVDGGKAAIFGISRTIDPVKLSLKYGLGMKPVKLGYKGSTLGRLFSLDLNFPGYKISPDSIIAVKTTNTFINSFIEGVKAKPGFHHIITIAAEVSTSPLMEKLSGMNELKGYTIIFQGRNPGEWIKLEHGSRTVEKGLFNLGNDKLKIDYEKVQRYMLEAEGRGEKVVIGMHQGGIFGTDIYTHEKVASHGTTKAKIKKPLWNVEQHDLIDEYTTATNKRQQHERDRGITVEKIIGAITLKDMTIGKTKVKGFIDIDIKTYGEKGRFMIQDIKEGANGKIRIKVRNNIIEGELLSDGRFKAEVVQARSHKTYILTNKKTVTPKELAKILSINEKLEMGQNLLDSVRDSGNEVMRKTIRGMEANAKNLRELKLLKKIQADWEAVSNLNTATDFKSIDPKLEIQKTAERMKEFSDKWMKDKSFKLLSEKNQATIRGMAECNMEIRLPESSGKVTKGFYQAETPEEWVKLINEGASKKLYPNKVIDTMGAEGRNPIVKEVNKIKFQKDGGLDINGMLPTLARHTPRTVIPSNLPYNAQTVLGTPDPAGFTLGGTIGNIVGGYDDGNLAFALELGRNMMVVTPIILGNIDTGLLNSQIRFMETQFEGVTFSKPASGEDFNLNQRIIVGGESAVNKLNIDPSKMDYNEDALQYSIFKINRFVEFLGQDTAAEFINAEGMGLSNALGFINAVGLEKAITLVGTVGPREAVNTVNSYMKAGNLNQLADSINAMPKENFIKNIGSLTEFGVDPGTVFGAVNTNSNPLLARIMYSGQDFTILQNNLREFSQILYNQGRPQNAVEGILTDIIASPELLQYLAMKNFPTQEVGSLIQQGLPITLAISASPYIHSMTPQQLWMFETTLTSVATEFNVGVQTLTSLLKPIAEGNPHPVQNIRLFSEGMKVTPSTVLNAVGKNPEFAQIMMSSEDITKSRLYTNFGKITQELTTGVASSLLSDPQFIKAMNSPKFMENP